MRVRRRAQGRAVRTERVVRVESCRRALFLFFSRLVILSERTEIDSRDITYF